MEDVLNSINDISLIVCLLLLALVWFFVVALLVKRDQLTKLALSIKVSIALYFLQMVIQIVKYAENPERYLQYRATILTFNFTFYLNHWIFTWHYVEAASLFRLTFGQQSLATLSRIDKRKKKLKVCNWLTYSVLVIGQATLTYFSMNTDKYHVNFFGIEYAINSIFMALLAVLSLCAMWHI